MITILLLFNVCKAQIDTVKVDTIASYVYYTDTTHYYDYINPNGEPAWKDVKGYDSTLIPEGGWSVQKSPVNPYHYVMNGFAIIRWRKDGSMDELIGFLDNKKKKINKTCEPVFLQRKK